MATVTDTRTQVKASDQSIRVDPQDAWLLEVYQWTVVTPPNSKTQYARREGRDDDGKHKAILLHRVIVDAPDGIDVDHINGNGLDNRRCNLRLATTSQNIASQRLARDNTSGRKGVYWNRQARKWHAQIGVAGKRLYLGQFTDLDDAARAYDKAALEHFGEFALTNEMLGLFGSSSSNYATRR